MAFFSWGEKTTTSSLTELFTDLWHRHRHKPRDFDRVLGEEILRETPPFGWCIQTMGKNPWDFNDRFLSTGEFEPQISGCHQ